MCVSSNLTPNVVFYNTTVQDIIEDFRVLESMLDVATEPHNYDTVGRHLLSYKSQYNWISWNSSNLSTSKYCSNSSSQAQKNF